MPSHFLSILKRFRLSPFALQIDWRSLCHHFSFFPSSSALIICSCKNMLSLYFFWLLVHTRCLLALFYLLMHFFTYFSMQFKVVLCIFMTFLICWMRYTALAVQHFQRYLHRCHAQIENIRPHLQFYRRIISSILLFSIFVSTICSVFNVSTLFSLLLLLLLLWLLLSCS